MLALLFCRFLARVLKCWSCCKGLRFCHSHLMDCLVILHISFLNSEMWILENIIPIHNSSHLFRLSVFFCASCSKIRIFWPQKNIFNSGTPGETLLLAAGSKVQLEAHFLQVFFATIHTVPLSIKTSSTFSTEWDVASLRSLCMYKQMSSQVADPDSKVDAITIQVVYNDSR